MKRWFLTLAGALVFSVSSYGATKSLAEHWEDVGLTYSLVEDNFSNQNCFNDERSFLGCVNAINTALNSNGWSLIPQERRNEGFGAVLKDFGQILVVESRKSAAATVAEILTEARKERRKAHEAWVKLYKKSSAATIDVNAIATWLSEQSFFKDKEAVLAASLLNTYLMVVRDPHTMIVPASYVREASTGSGEKFSGIGAVFRSLTANGKKRLVVDTPQEGSPAQKAGLRAGDYLLKVDGEDVTQLEFSEVVSRIRGKEGAPVTLTVERDGKFLEIKIVRGSITVSNVQAKVLPTVRHKLGYLKLNSFLRPTGCDDLKAGLRDLLAENVDGVIFDLRGNGGGLLTQSVCVANLFLNKGATVVSTKSSSLFGLTQVLRTEERPMTSLPMVTLVDQGSASASEIVSGALQDHQRSLIVGTTTFGKGTVQNQRVLKGGALVMRETIGRFYLPSGRSNQISGVIPDFEVFANPNPTPDDKVAYREEDEYLAYPGQGDPWKQPRPEVIADVNGCMNRKGTAESRYKSHNGPMRADYQRFFAEDVLSCAIDLDVAMPMAEALGPDSLLPPVAFGAR